MMANFQSNLIIVCYFKRANESLGQRWPSGIQFYKVIVLDHMFHKTTIYVLYKI